MRARGSFAVAFVVAAVAAFAAPALGAPPGIEARPFIKHVVVIVQENRTFDNLFGGIRSENVRWPMPYYGADAAWPRKVAPLMKYAPLASNGAYGSHDAWACLNQGTPYPRFSMQQWIAVAKHRVTSPAVCTAHDYWFFRYVPQSQRRIYWEIARTYGLGDAFFAATSSASYPPHQFLVAGDAEFKRDGKSWWLADQPEPEGGCFDDYPTSSAPVVGMDYFTKTLKDFTDSRGHCYDRATYGDALTAAGRSWMHYTTALPTDSGVFDGFINNRNWYQQTQQLTTNPAGVTNHFAAATQVLKDAGSLARFVWVKPPCIEQSDHPGQLGGGYGPNWVGSVINAIGESSDWSSTVIFVIWDDWGGFYDHVVPPTNLAQRLGPGVRIPFLVVSPYLAHPGHVVHTVGHVGSIMRFADELLGLEPLTAFDKEAPELTGWFDFSPNTIAHPFVQIKGATGSGVWNDAMCAGSAKMIRD